MLKVEYQGTVEDLQPGPLGMQPVYTTRFTIGKHGPFTVQLGRAEFTKERLETEVRKLAEVVSAIYPNEK